MTTLRKAAVSARIAWVRLARRPERFTLAALGIAVGAAVLAGVEATSLAAQDRSLGRAVAHIPATDGAVRVVWGETPAQEGSRFAALDATARRAIRATLRREPFAVVLMRETEFGSRPVELGGVERLGRWVDLRSGRLPRPCAPRSCEVVQVGGGDRLPRPTAFRLRVVGRGRLRSALPLGRLLSSGAESSPVRVPVLLGKGARGLAAAPALVYDYRTYTWVVPVTPGMVHTWSVHGLLRRIERLRARLQASGGFEVDAPDDQLRTASARATVGGRRLLLLGGSAAALLLAFAVLAAAGMRRDVALSRRRLQWLGARGWQIALVQVFECAGIALVGAVVGWAAGIGLGALAADRLGAAAGPILTHSVLSGGGIAVAGTLAALGALVLVATLSVPTVRIGGVSVTAADIGALGALGVVLVGVSRGAADAASLAAGRGTGGFLLLLPALVAFVAAVACARALVPMLRLVERLGRRAPVPIRLAAVSLARAPGRAAVVVTFLVVSVGIAFFAAAYRSTLVQNERDQAAYAAPRDVLASENLARLVPVEEAAPARAWRRAGDAAPVLRLAGDVPESSGGLTLLGIPARTVPTLDGWRGDFSSRSLADLARRIEPGRDVRMRGLRLPPHGRLLAIPARWRGRQVKLDLDVETPRGTFVTPALTAARDSLRAQLPRAARGGLAVGIDFELPPTGLHDAQAGLQPYFLGSLRLGAPRVDGRRLRPPWPDWVGVDGASARVHGASVDVRYVVSTDVTTRYRARQPTDGRPVPVVVSPALAAASDHGLLPVEIEGQQLATRVVGTADRFPTIDGEFVLADRQTVATALNAQTPGSAVTNEIWIDARPPQTAAQLERTLRRPPFADLTIVSRRALERSLRSDPLGRGALYALGAAAAVALALALFGLVLSLVFDLRDERGELFDLESQGAGPAVLRRHVRLRVLLVAAFGAVGGIVTGLLLGAVAVSLVRVTAGAAAAQPPLRLVVDWAVLAAVLAGLALAGAAVVAAVSARAAGRRWEVGA